MRRRELQLQRYQVLLRAVVQVALDPAPLGVLRRDQALPGHRQLFQPLAELGGKALILEREPRLVRQVVDQPGLGRRNVLTFHHGHRSQQLALVSHGHGRGGIGHGRWLARLERQPGLPRAVRRP